MSNLLSPASVREKKQSLLGDHDDDRAPTHHQGARSCGCPVYGWEIYAAILSVVYGSAIAGLANLGNPLAAAGWAICCLSCFVWFLYFRQERIREAIFDPEKHSQDTSNMAHSPLSQPTGLTPHTTTVDRVSFPPPPLPPYATLSSLLVLSLFTVLTTSTAGFLLYYAVSRHADLSGDSVWLAFISWTMAVKCEGQLFCSLLRSRWRWTKAREMGAPEITISSISPTAARSADVV